MKGTPMAINNVSTGFTTHAPHGHGGPGGLDSGDKKILNELINLLKQQGSKEKEDIGGTHGADGAEGADDPQKKRLMALLEKLINGSLTPQEAKELGQLLPQANLPPDLMEKLQAMLQKMQGQGQKGDKEEQGYSTEKTGQNI
jgi:hypothetical protein